MNEVPFHELPTHSVTLRDGIGTRCPNGSEVEVWKVMGGDSLHIKLRRQLDDGSKSKLGFGMSRESALALVGLLQWHLYPEEKKSECLHDKGHELNGVGMWICLACRADITPDDPQDSRAQ
jgi:hypothetical protein